jgi:hypothetical protein
VQVLTRTCANLYTYGKKPVANLYTFGNGTCCKSLHVHVHIFTPIEEKRIEKKMEFLLKKKESNQEDKSKPVHRLRSNGLSETKKRQKRKDSKERLFWKKIRKLEN